MNGMTSKVHIDVADRHYQQAEKNFIKLLEHVYSLYCSGGSSSLSTLEAHELTMSVSYVLGIVNATREEAVRTLDVRDPIVLWHEKLTKLDARIDAVLQLWQEIVVTMPPLRNVSLRDTLSSISEIKSCYDTRFAAHEVPCDIDYQLSEPVDCSLMGIDYIEAWLEQLLSETSWITQFDVESCERVLESECPDYRGLHVNLYDILLPHESELVKRRI